MERRKLNDYGVIDLALGKLIASGTSQADILSIEAKLKGMNLNMPVVLNQIGYARRVEADEKGKVKVSYVKLEKIKS
jgi:hypothetical protein